MKFYVAVIPKVAIVCSAVRPCSTYQVDYGGCSHIKHHRTDIHYKFRTSVGQAKADVTRNKGAGKVLVGNTDDLAALDATEQEQYEHFESRMIANAQAAQTIATTPAPKPKHQRKRKTNEASEVSPTTRRDQRSQARR